ncbi:MAG: flagellar export chaperone FlgN [Eubacteriales bacterium]|jgi:flagellar biosynthesis/type III secretory pathway chaperone
MSNKQLSLEEILDLELALAKKLVSAAETQQHALREGNLKELSKANDFISETNDKLNFLNLKKLECLNQNKEYPYEEKAELTQLKNNIVNLVQQLKEKCQTNALLSQNGINFHYQILSVLCTPEQQKVYNPKGKVKETLQVNQMIDRVF